MNECGPKDKQADWEMEEARRAWVRAGSSSIHRRSKQASKEAKQQANIPRAAHFQSLSPDRSSLCVTTTTGTALATKWLRVRTTAMSCFPVSFRATNCNLKTYPNLQKNSPKSCWKNFKLASDTNYIILLEILKMSPKKPFSKNKFAWRNRKNLLE